MDADRLSEQFILVNFARLGLRFLRFFGCIDLTEYPIVWALGRLRGTPTTPTHLCRVIPRLDSGLYAPLLLTSMTLGRAAQALRSAVKKRPDGD